MRKEAEESMKRITGNLGKDIQEMKTSFDNLGKTHIEQSTAIKAKMEETVRSLGEKTKAIGSQAEDLAKAAAIDHAAALTLKKEYIMPTLRKEYKLAE